MALTNDDGVDAPGLAAFARALADAGHHTVIVAPERDHSAAGTGLRTARGSGSVRRTTVADLPAFAVDATPAACAVLALSGEFGDVDALVAGINPGVNVGHALIASGTFGAALTATARDRPGVAVSIATPCTHLASAAAVGVAIADALVSAQPNTIVANVNVPDRTIDDLLELRVAEPAPYTRSGRVRLEPTDDPERLTIVLQPDSERAPLTGEAALLERGHPVLSFLRLEADSASAPAVAAAAEASLRRRVDR